MSTASEHTGPTRPRRRVLRWIVVSTLIALVASVGGFAVWASIAMPADPARLAEVAVDPGIEVEDAGTGIVLRPTDGATGTGIVVIAGARVDPAAYAWTTAPLVDQGVTVVIAAPTLHFALLDARPIETFTALAPEVGEWVVAGHSLGGVRACQYLHDEPSTLAGLILLGSYCAIDLDDAALPVLSVAGSADGLSTPAKIADAASRLPDDTRFIEIDGMSHAQFGAYGNQPGDGIPTIDDETAREAMTAAILDFLGR